jgi:hypothetical protein
MSSLTERVTGVLRMMGRVPAALAGLGLLTLLAMLWGLLGGLGLGVGVGGLPVPGGGGGQNGSGSSVPVAATKPPDPATAPPKPPDKTDKPEPKPTPAPPPKPATLPGLVETPDAVELHFRLPGDRAEFDGRPVTWDEVTALARAQLERRGPDGKRKVRIVAHPADDTMTGAIEGLRSAVAGMDVEIVAPSVTGK